MWTRTYSKTFQGLNKDKVWALWQDIDNWPSWHDDLEYCQLQGDFIVGNHFILKPKDGPKVKIELVAINEGHSFSDCTRFFGAKMIDTHEVIETAEGICLKNTLTVTGPLTWLWRKLVINHIAATIPDETDALAKLASKADA